MIRLIDNARMDGCVAIAVIVAEPGRDRPRPDASPQEWYIDTGYNGEAFCWNFHVERADLKPAENRVPGQLVKLRTSLRADQKPLELPIRRADLWLVSNVDELRPAPLRLELDPGIVLRDAPMPDADREPRALIGMRALRRAKVRLELNFDEGVYSLLVPDDYPRPVAAD